MHEWTKQIADWWTANYPTTNLDLEANSNLAANLNFPQPLFPLYPVVYTEWYKYPYW
jgi:hypothetical protein